MNLKGRMFQHNFREPRFEATKIAMCSQKIVLKALKKKKKKPTIIRTVNIIPDQHSEAENFRPQITELKLSNL